MRTYTVAVAGLGLIGGSLALAAQRAPGWQAVGIDRDPAVLQAAAAAGLTQTALPAGEETDAASPAARLLAEADLVILALPPQAVPSFLEAHAPYLRPGTVVSDVCGVKRRIVQVCEPICAAKGLRFIGGHPMAGKEHSGFGQADAELFKGASYILTPTSETDPAALQMMRDFAAALGCGRVTVASPEHHDRMIAFTSQLPHVLAGAYMQSPVSGQHQGYSAGSYRDVSRVATVDETLWSRLFLLNKDCLLEEIEGLSARLAEYRAALLAEDRESLEEILRRGRLRKEETDNQ